jgi:hypothetical protein
VADGVLGTVAPGAGSWNIDLVEIARKIKNACNPTIPGYENNSAAVQRTG